MGSAGFRVWDFQGFQVIRHTADTQVQPEAQELMARAVSAGSQARAVTPAIQATRALAATQAFPASPGIPVTAPSVGTAPIPGYSGPQLTDMDNPD